MHIFYFVLFFIGAACLQDFKLSLNKKPESGDEKRYPNGTVIGKYTYMDDAGNPIEVKYYADNTGYGVELKSIKLGDSSSKTSVIQADKIEFFAKTDEIPVKPEPENGPGLENLSVNYPPYLKESEALGYLNKGNNKMNLPKLDKTSSDYEVFYKNELRGPKKWTNDKVRVYLEKDKRRARNSYGKNKFQD